MNKSALRLAFSVSSVSLAVYPKLFGFLKLISFSDVLVSFPSFLATNKAKSKYSDMIRQTDKATSCPHSHILSYHLFYSQVLVSGLKKVRLVHLS